MSAARPATAVSLAAYSTLRVGGPAARMVTVTSEPELVDTLAELDAAPRSGPGHRSASRVPTRR